MVIFLPHNTLSIILFSLLCLCHLRFPSRSTIQETGPCVPHQWPPCWPPSAFLTGRSAGKAKGDEREVGEWVQVTYHPFPTPTHTAPSLWVWLWPSSRVDSSCWATFWSSHALWVSGITPSLHSFKFKDGNSSPLSPVPWYYRTIPIASSCHVPSFANSSFLNIPFECAFCFLMVSWPICSFN